MFLLYAKLGLWKKRLQHRFFFRKFSEIFKNIVFTQHLQTTAPANPIKILRNKCYDTKELHKILFSIWIFFHEHSRMRGLQGKREGISLTPHCHFHPLHWRLDINRVIAAGSSPLPIGSRRSRIGNIWFTKASHWSPSYAPERKNNFFI